MKVIFLDIDGVLHSQKHEKWLKRHGLHWYDADGAVFDPKCIRALEYVITETDAEIVISSSWKDNPNCQNVLEILRGIWERRRLPGDVIDITPTLPFQDYRNFSQNKWKGYEVKQWLKNNPECEAFAIVDDQNLFLREQNSRFVRTSPKDGLTMNKAKDLVRILKRDSMARNRNYELACPTFIKWLMSAKSIISTTTE